MSLNATLRHRDLCQTAMAMALVANQRFHDTNHPERNMGLPADQEAGLREGSPITFAHPLEGHFLLACGTGDDNCHDGSCEALVNELIRHQRPCVQMPHPNRTHALQEGKNTRRHLFDTLTRFLEATLPASAASEPAAQPTGP